MTHGPQREPDAQSQWRSLHALERLLSASVWGLCAGFIWAGVRAWLAGAGVAMMVIALIVSAVAALALPHIKHAAFRHVMSDGANSNIDDEWRRFNTR